MSSLDTVWAALKGSGPGELDDVLPDGYTRSLGVDGLARVNPFQVEAGNAPDPATDPGSDYSLDDWDGYLHSSFFPHLGLDLEVVSLAWNAIEIAWTRPDGYTRDLPNVTQRVYWKDMGTSEDTNVNPFDSPDGSALVGDVSTYTISGGIASGHYYAIGVKQEWDDSDEVYTPNDGDGYAGMLGHTILLGAGQGISSGEIPDPPPPPGIDANQETHPDDCAAACSNCVSVSCQYDAPVSGMGTMTLQRNISSAGWTNVVTGITTGGTHFGTYNGFDTVQFRIFYDSDPGTIIDSDTVSIQCNQI